jgi:2'-hydroxyisoflavone reductase
MKNANRRDFLKLSAVTGASVGLGLGLGSSSSFGLAQSEAGAGANPAKKTLLILGGTAFLGPEIVESAEKRGYTITLFNRGKTHPELFPNLEKLKGDRDSKKDEGLNALQGRKWDVVVDTSGYIPRHVKESAELLADNVKQYVFISTISVYAGFAQPGMDETAPVGKMDDETSEVVSGTSYGPLKALCEQAAEKAMPGRVTNIRPGLIVGPGDPTDRYTYWPVRVARGGEVLSPGTPSDPVQLIDVRDLAEWTLKTIEDKTVGVFNATGPANSAPLTIGAMLDACKTASGSDAKFTWADAEFLASQGVQPWGHMPVWIPPAGEMGGMTQTDVSKAVAKGLTFRPHADTARDTLKWWNGEPEERRKQLRAGLPAEREKVVLEAFHARDEKKG